MLKGRKKLRVAQKAIEWSNDVEELEAVIAEGDNSMDQDDGTMYDSNGIFEAMKLLQAKYQDKTSKSSQGKKPREERLNTEPTKQTHAVQVEIGAGKKKKQSSPTAAEPSPIECVAKVINPSSISIAEPLTASPPKKLTKQQKRDLKRNKMAAEASAASAQEDSFASAAIPIQSTEIAGYLSTTKEEGTSVYKRTPRLPVTMPHLKTAKRFLVPGDEQYKKVLATAYDNFKLDPPNAFSESFHNRFTACLDTLDDAHVYQFDITQPLGLNTKLAKTFVSRCLVGSSGITYKYLGLRMFSYSWDQGAIGATEAFVELGRLNRELTERSKKHLSDYASSRQRKFGADDASVGSCEYNMTLINRCFPEGKGYPQLKEEPMFRNENCSVSWHADSSLEHYSTIAVYQYSKETADATASADAKSSKGLWKIAMRVKNNCEGPFAGKLKTAANQAESDLSTSTTPAVACPLVDGTTYYMLDEFNHHHQHCVLPGSSDRISSTHRVSRLDGHTFQSIRGRCLTALQASGMDSKAIRPLLLACIEVEFEWVRQFYIQGQQHVNSHIWWHGPMEELLSTWKKLQDRVALAVVALHDASLFDFNADGELDTNIPIFSELSRKQLSKRRSRAAQVDPELYQTVIDGLTEIHEKRQGWKAREADPLYRKQPKAQQPISPIPFPTLERPLSLRGLNVSAEDMDSSRKTKTNLRESKKTESDQLAEGELAFVGEPEGKRNQFEDVLAEPELQNLVAVIAAVRQWFERFSNKSSLVIESTSPEVKRKASTEANELPRKSAKKQKFIVINEKLL